MIFEQIIEIIEISCQIVEIISAILFWLTILFPTWTVL